MAWSAAVPEPRLDSEGRHLCSTARCAGLAVTQVVVECDGCREFAEESAAAASTAQARIDEIERNGEQLIARVADEQRDPTQADRQELLAHLEPLPGLRADVKRHQRRAAAHASPHTHPLFGCKKHEVTP